MGGGLLGQQLGVTEQFSALACLGRQQDLCMAQMQDYVYLREGQSSMYMRQKAISALGVDPVIAEMRADLTEYLKDWNK